jgi:uncharacterized protein
MPLCIQLRDLDNGPIRLCGTLPLKELELGDLGEVLRGTAPLRYDLRVELVSERVLASGELCLDLEADCVRCLKPIPVEVRLAEWQGILPLSGEEAVPVVDDSVDLTPPLREDIFLALPQHPLCDLRCGGLLQAPARPADLPTGTIAGESSSVWDALNKLQF